ncbi:3'-5' exonuclease [uncultured Veillonella sp.]|uniref:3'-5' exonuclease n=1 Tax=uncultured Veillonella sp. TaxID=159268 RepID=UPI0028DB35D1|nr:3'-5' exonuclease [uncultured Veillonella sp.]
MLINREQQRVIDEVEQNILLLASAGTGKTNTLAYRVAHLIEGGYAKAENILCMTFTNKAANEMKDRIQSLVGSPAKAVEVSTFHSFCFFVLQQEGKRNETLYTDVTIFDEEDCKELSEPYRPGKLREISFAAIIAMVKEYRSLYGFYSDNLVGDYKRTIERLQKEQRAAIEQQFSSFGNVLYSELHDFLKHGHEWIAAYDESLASVHGLDFTDLICGVHRLFQDPVVRERWRSRYSYISVDEMQDTGVLEYKVLEMLWEGNHVLLCGDYFQTIYEWRGSDPFTLLKDFDDKFKPEKIIFYENYRSNWTLFTMAFKTLQNMFPDLVGNIYAQLPCAFSATKGKPVRIVGCRNEYLEGRYIYEAIDELPRDASIAVLVRDNKKAIRLSESFERLNGERPEEERRQFMIIDEFKFFRRQEIKDVMAYFKLLMNPNDSVSAKRIIKRYVAGIGDARIAAIESPETRKTGLKLTDFMDMPIFEAEPYAKLVQGLSQGEVIVYDVESTGTDTVNDNIIQIAAIRINEQGKVLETFERFIKPEKSVGDSEEVHGFSDEYLQEHGEDPATVLQAFKEFSKNAIIVGHNVNYDIAIFTNELARHDLGNPEFKAVYDTLDIYRRFYPNLPNHKLGFLASQFPINHEPTHNAMDDILATAQLLIYAVNENIVPTTTDRMVAINKYKAAFTNIASQMATLRRKAYTELPTKLLAYIMNQMGVLEYYKSHGELAKVENIRDLYRIMEKLDEAYEGPVGLARLNQILQMAALTAGEPMQQVRGQERIPIITVHQSKGSEFDYVFLAGLNEGSFPSPFAIAEGRDAEEMRLFYVAITRPKKELVITFRGNTRMGRGMRPSPLLDYMPRDPELVERRY